MSKVLVDTNLLIDDEKILCKLTKEYDVILIPATVLKELDELKRKPNLKYSASRAISEILHFKEANPDKIKFIMNDNSVSTNDEKIIEASVTNEACLVTKDIAMHLLAETRKIENKLYRKDENGLFDPYYYIELNDDLFCKCGEDVFSFEQRYEKDTYEVIIRLFEELSGRQMDKDGWFFIILKTYQGLFVYANNPIKGNLVRIDNDPRYKYMEAEKGMGIKALDIYQNCAFFALREAEHVLITGKWGSGKSLISTAYALSESDKKIFITRPNKGITSEFDIGFRPGDLFEKMIDWCGGFISALYFLYGNARGQTKRQTSYDHVKEEIFKNSFEILQIDSIQGVSLLEQDILMVDEVQLISVDYLSMILSRMSKGSKLILLGDLAQSYSAIRSSESGLRKLLYSMPDKSLAYVNLQHSYRSDITKLAEKLQIK